MGQCLDRFQYSGTARHIGNLLCHKAAHLEVQHLCLRLSFGAATTCIRQGRWAERASSLETILDYVLHKPLIKPEAEQVPKPHHLPSVTHSSAGCQVYTQELCVPAVPDRQATGSQSQVSISATIRFLCRQKQGYGCRVELHESGELLQQIASATCSVWEFHLSKDP